ncbi:hypothetical protein LQZ21_09620 [Treponema sp. TIM-1]|uniref:hypothetical protein n=1 Tax=Treponema sp. TIM-1 TaxID=2898417 RepID=UPI0039813537
MEINKPPYRPLRLGLLIYDLFRLIFMLELLITVIPLGESPEASWFPYMVYAVPNALFPLMAFFLFIRPGEYRGYVFLYLAGKTIVIVSVIGWIIFSLQRILGSAGSLLELIRISGLVFCFIILDTASLVGTSLLKGKLYPKPPPEPEEIGEGDTIPQERGVS